MFVLHVHVSMLFSMLHIQAVRPCCMLMLHTRVECQCCIPMLFVYSAVHASCPCCMPLLMPMLHVHVSMLHVHAGCPPCCMSMLKVRAAFPYSMSTLNIYAACPCCLSIISVPFACPFSMPMLHIHAACPRCISTLLDHVACLSCMILYRVQLCVPMLYVHPLCPCSMSMSPCCMFMPLVHAPCLSFTFVLHVHTPYQCCMSMLLPMLQVHSAWHIINNLFISCAMYCYSTWWLVNITINGFDLICCNFIKNFMSLNLFLQNLRIKKLLKNFW